MSKLTAQISNLEQGLWTPQTGPSINPVAADWYPNPPVLNADKSLSFSMYSSKQFGGVLFKQSNPLPFKASTISTTYRLRIWPALLTYGQVIETDLKVTDDALFTYPGDFQWNLAEGWMAQSGNPWFDLGVKITPPAIGVWTDFVVTRAFDWVARTVAVTLITVNGVQMTPKIVAIPAANVGWKNPMGMVDQVQLCNNAMPGSYGFDMISMGHAFS